MPSRMLGTLINCSWVKIQRDEDGIEADADAAAADWRSPDAVACDALILVVALAADILTVQAGNRSHNFETSTIIQQSYTYEDAIKYYNYNRDKGANPIKHEIVKKKLCDGDDNENKTKH